MDRWWDCTLQWGSSRRLGSANTSTDRTCASCTQGAFGGEPKDNQELLSTHRAWEWAHGSSQLLSHVLPTSPPILQHQHRFTTTHWSVLLLKQAAKVTAFSLFMQFWLLRQARPNKCIFPASRFKQPQGIQQWTEICLIKDHFLKNLALAALLKVVHQVAAEQTALRSCSSTRSTNLT